jgi:DNA (cytosine-5)-methyltransferase 1
MTGPTAIDLFAGAGGLSLGLAAAGFDVALASEWVADACASYEAHHPGTPVRDDDLRVLLQDGTLSRLRGQIDLVAGGPPCQPFSTGGKRLAGEDPRDGVPMFLEAVQQVQPRAVLLENVAGLTSPARRPYLRGIVTALATLGYQVAEPTVLTAADFGVPQIRRRLLVVGRRDDTFRFPEPTHGPGRPRPWVTAGDVLDPAQVVGEPNPAIVTYARNPQTRPSAYDGLLCNGGGRPIDLTRPARTILASAGGNKTPFLDTLGVVPGYHRHLLAGGQPRHGEVPGARRITVAEAAMLQSFPPGLAFAGSRSSQYRQVGNAVPPLLAAAVGRALADHLR